MPTASSGSAGSPESSLHAIVTDPPYGVKKLADDQLAKRGENGGIWRIPPQFDGSARAPLPRFTALVEGGLEFRGELKTARAHAARRLSCCRGRALGDGLAG